MPVDLDGEIDSAAYPAALCQPVTYLPSPQHTNRLIVFDLQAIVWEKRTCNVASPGSSDFQPNRFLLIDKLRA